jgi:hypothetical protein
MIRWLNRPLTSATTTAMPRAGHQVGVVFVAVDFVGFAPGVRDAHADAGQFPFQVPGQGQRGQRGKFRGRRAPAVRTPHLLRNADTFRQVMCTWVHIGFPQSLWL